LASLDEIVHLQRASALVAASPNAPRRYRLICGTDMRSCGDAWVLDGECECENVNCPRCLAILDREAGATA
jgi:hypothetical protein